MNTNNDKVVLYQAFEDAEKLDKVLALYYVISLLDFFIWVVKKVALVISFEELQLF